MSLSSSQKGRVVEQLIGALLLLGSDGKLRVSVPLVDDEGVDLLVGDRKSDTAILLQIKSRFSLSGRGRYRAEVRKATLRSSQRRFILFVYCDEHKGEIGDVMWLVPATVLVLRLSGQRRTRTKYIFDSTFISNDMWTEYRISKQELASKIMKFSRIRHNDRVGQETDRS